MKKFEELEAMQKKKAAQAKVFLQMVNNDQINGDGDGSMENGEQVPCRRFILVEN